VREITGRPHRADESENDELRSTRICLGIGLSGATSKTASQVLLHQRDFSDKVSGGSDRVELDEGDQVRDEGGDGRESGNRARGQDQGVIEQDSKEFLPSVSQNLETSKRTYL
jgi:hypothetical protein